MGLSAGDFQFVSDFVRKRTAIVLEEEKTYLVETRLSALARREGIESLEVLIGYLRGRNPNGLEEKVVDAMTTNETSFFRDVHPFEALKNDILPRAIERNAASKRIAIWCAASSSGQEPYTIAMLIREKFPELADWNLTFIASDISDEMLERCRRGVYSQLEVNRGLPATYLVKYFEKDGAEWRIREDIRMMIDFRQVNLIGDWPFMPRLDIVFIRNVLIYFDVDTKRKILGGIRERMVPGGVLFLGGAETTMNIDPAYVRMKLERGNCYTTPED